jgi:hypothetical protein
VHGYAVGFVGHPLHDQGAAARTRLYLIEQCRLEVHDVRVTSAHLDEIVLSQRGSLKKTHRMHTNTKQKEK